MSKDSKITGSGGRACLALSRTITSRTGAGSEDSLPLLLEHTRSPMLARGGLGPEHEELEAGRAGLQ